MELTKEQIILRREILDLFIESLNAEAAQMARGLIPMVSGPVALRNFGANINREIIEAEG
jgi:hypothetical protein